MKKFACAFPPHIFGTIFFFLFIPNEKHAIKRKEFFFSMIFIVFIGKTFCFLSSFVFLNWNWCYWKTWSDPSFIDCHCFSVPGFATWEIRSTRCNNYNKTQERKTMWKRHFFHSVFLDDVIARKTTTKKKNFFWWKEFATVFSSFDTTFRFLGFCCLVQVVSTFIFLVMSWFLFCFFREDEKHENYLILC